MKVRVKFSKLGVMKYIGHLDMMRYFQKAVSRAKLPINYSEGFNPHQIMSFGAPLGLGMTSDGEYMDIDIHTEIPSKEAIKALNDNMVDSVIVHSFKYLPEKSKNAMAANTASSYLLTIKDDYENNVKVLNDKINEFLSQKNHFIIKKTKKSEKEIDILPLIYDFKCELLVDKSTSSFDNCAFEMLVSSGSDNNLKPDTVLCEFFKFIGIEIEKNQINIHRIDMYTGEKDNLISLDDVGESR